LLKEPSSIVEEREFKFSLCYQFRKLLEHRYKIGSLCFTKFKIQRSPQLDNIIAKIKAHKSAFKKDIVVITDAVGLNQNN
jgi:hypothetical protein